MIRRSSGSTPLEPLLSYRDTLDTGRNWLNCAPAMIGRVVGVFPMNASSTSISAPGLSEVIVIEPEPDATAAMPDAMPAAPNARFPPAA